MGQFILYSKFDASDYVTKLCISGESETSVSEIDSWRCLSISQATNPLTALFIVYVIVCCIFTCFVYVFDALTIVLLRIALHFFAVRGYF